MLKWSGGKDEELRTSIFTNLLKHSMTDFLPWIILIQLYSITPPPLLLMGSGMILWSKPIWNIEIVEVTF